MAVPYPDKMKISIICLLSGFVFLSTCAYDNEEDLYPDRLANCDTTNVTFNSKIIFILAKNCFVCHDHAVADRWGDGIHLEAYDDVKSRIERISNAINHTGGVSPMPKNTAKLNACTLKQFEIWISNGIPEN
jgi:hypothetical protein